MYRLLIADDEKIIREGLRCLLDWESLGFTEITEAANGEQTLRQITEQKPDIVLLDIHMPGISGLDVIAKARSEGFDGRVIILTGYSEFKYAQQAIRYGVTDYLMKPVDENELLSIVTDLCTQLAQARSSTQTASRYRAYALDPILYDILNGTADIAQLNLADLQLSADVYQVVICEKYGHSADDAAYRFSDLLRTDPNDRHMFHAITIDNRETVLLKGKASIARFGHMLDHYQNRQNPQKNSPLDSLFLAYGRRVQTLAEVPLSYQEAHALILRRFFCQGNQHTVSYQSLPELSGKKPVISKELLDSYASRLYDSISSFRRGRTAEILENLQELLYNASDPIDTIRLFLTDLFLQIRERMNRHYANAGIPFPDNAQIIRLINGKNYLYEIILFFTEQFEMAIATIGTASGDTVIDDVLEYINHNYARSIKLENIALLFGYNSSYLGKLFSKKVGENFNAYLDRIRIERAKELLKNDSLKVYTIAENVGYSNVDYFHIKFKKFTGKTPAEFRRGNTPPQLTYVVRYISQKTKKAPRALPAGI